ncbi:NADPH:quinone oxidoreductase family protein [Palleronia sp. LCG004]|uniref:NADPH:quinone oxidoreductase family protein n=1 Tax=Palleronia sp. LCG004 TaxID=3079304 RepID=UPI002943342D|nr:NADPH:quinone oxidoreductase family protein [Palleronia sp. LCG004]WOI57541.1 NADPH:quinone oxidoreductase family protein [Palleronia sp. LCG004]
MRAFRITDFSQMPSVEDVPRPEPGPSQVRVRIAACALNFADLLMLKGTYQDTPPLPFSPGMEVAGTIDAVGSGVGDLAQGARVAVFAGHGGLAEWGVFDAARARILPETMPFEDAAAIQIAHGTAHLALSHRARLAAGERLVVLGAAGGVGLAAVEIGKLMGAEVVAVARGSDRLAVAKAAGADHLIDGRDPDLRGALKALGGADVLLDPVGGSASETAMRALRPEARVVLVGFASGDVPNLAANHLLVKNVSVLGVYWGGYMAFAPAQVAASLDALLAWYAEGRLHPHIGHRLPLDRVAEGLDLMAGRGSTGKIVITMG